MILMQQFWLFLKDNLVRPVHSGTKMPHLEGLRFFAFLLVFLQHLSERLIKHGITTADSASLSDTARFVVSRGTVGVFLFFAISGFLLAIQSERINLNQSVAQVKTFLLKRICRLWLPYALVMTGMAAVFFISNLMPANELVERYVSSLFFLHGVSYGSYSVLNPVAWTLEVEIQFYLVAPIALLMLRKVLPLLLFRLSIVVLLYLVTVVWQGQAYAWHFPMKTTLVGQVHHFMVGIGFGYWYLLGGQVRKGSILPDLVFFPALFLLGWSWTTELPKVLLMGLSTLAIMYSVFYGTYVRKWMSKKVFVFAGGITYSLYLIHLPLLEAASMMCMNLTINYPLAMLFHFLYQGVVVMAVGVVFFLLIEKPVMQAVVGWFSNTSAAVEHRSRNKSSQLTIALLLFLSLPVVGQSVVQSSVDSEPPGLKPIEQLYSKAILNAPLIKQNESKKQIIKNKERIAGRSWSQHLALVGSVNYGLGNVVENQFDGRLLSYNQLNRSNLQYTGGVALRLPVSEVATRSATKKLWEAEMQSLEAEGALHMQMLHMKLVETYFEAQQARQQVITAAAQLALHEVDAALAKAKFESGQLTFQYYKPFEEQRQKVQGQYNAAVVQYNRWVAALEVLVGEEVTL